jgi:hydroxymethylpyrimidine pyrophosphatase-like HAD family hydrolase
VVNKNNHLSAKLLDKDDAISIYKYLKTTDLRIELNTVSNRYWHTERDPDFPKEYYDSSNIVNDFENVIKYQPVILFLVIGECDKIRIAQKYINSNYNKAKAVMTSNTSLEILSKGISKGSTVVEMFPNASIVSIGDSENDFSMFELSKESYYVGKGSCDKATYNFNTIYDALKQIEKEDEYGRE